MEDSLHLLESLRFRLDLFLERLAGLDFLTDLTVVDAGLDPSLSKRSSDSPSIAWMALNIRERWWPSPSAISPCWAS